MNVYHYTAIASIAAVGAEVYMRAHVGQPWITLWPALVLALIVNYGIYGLLQSESLLGATILFSASTAGLRVLCTLALHDRVPLATWVAFALVMCASFVKTLGQA